MPRWRIRFRGAPHGAHAVFGKEDVEREVEASDKTAAQMSAYTTHEHIWRGHEGVKAELIVPACSTLENAEDGARPAEREVADLDRRIATTDHDATGDSSVDQTSTDETPIASRGSSDDQR